MSLGDGAPSFTGDLPCSRFIEDAMNNSTADRWIVILLIMVKLVLCSFRVYFSQRYGDNLRKANFPERNRNRLDIEDFLTEA